MTPPSTEQQRALIMYLASQLEYNLSDITELIENSYAKYNLEDIDRDEAYEFIEYLKDELGA